MLAKGLGKVFGAVPRCRGHNGIGPALQTDFLLWYTGIAFARCGKQDEGIIGQKAERLR